jgi:hypothetical protein
MPEETPGLSRISILVQLILSVCHDRGNRANSDDIKTPYDISCTLSNIIGIPPPVILLF